jgi:uncharacterized membrane protein YfcA
MNFTEIILAFIVLLACGSFGGFLAGLLGVGGGMLFIPVINEYLSAYDLNSGEIVKYTLANSIALVFMSGISGIFRQVKMGTWDWKQSLYIGIPGAISSWLMSLAIQQGDWYSKPRFQTAFLGFLLLSIANMIWGKSEIKYREDEPKSSKPSDWLAPLVGVIAGCVVSLSGLGGGIIMVPLFRMILKKPMHQSTSLSLSIVPILSITSLFQYALSGPTTHINHFQWGYLLGILLLPMMLGVLIFSSFGQKTAPRVPVLWLRVIFAVLSSIILIKTLIEINS